MKDHTYAIEIIQTLKSSDKELTLEDLTKYLTSCKVDVRKIDENTLNGALKDINDYIKNKKNASQSNPVEDQKLMQDVLGDYAKDPSWQALWPVIKKQANLKESQNTLFYEALAYFSEAADWKQIVASRKQPISNLPDSIVAQILNDVSQDEDYEISKSMQMAVQNIKKTLSKDAQQSANSNSSQAAQTSGTVSYEDFNGEKKTLDLSAYDQKDAAYISQKLVPFISNITKALDSIDPKYKKIFNSMMNGKTESKPAEQKNRDSATSSQSAERQSANSSNSLNSLFGKM